MPKRITFLLGAGAVIPWGAPKTKDITDAIIKDNKYHAKDKSSLGLYFKTILENHYRDSNTINFETILTLIEYLLDYFDSTTQKAINPLFTSAWPVLFKPQQFVEDTMDFYEVEFEQSSKTDEMVSYRIPKESSNSLNQYPKNRVSTLYYQGLMNDYLTIISSMIEKYCHYIDNHRLNIFFNNFIENFCDQGCIRRFYTTNYDLLVPKIIQSKLNIFDGFKVWNGQEDSYEQVYDYNLKRIAFDKDCDCYYNLHGSIYWGYEKQAMGEEERFRLRPKHPYFYNESRIRIKTNPGHNVLLSNIITGYNKLQRLSIPPFSYFLSSFAEDCLRSDLLIIIGSSFSDPYLNSIIREAVKAQDPDILLITKPNGGNYLTSFEGETFKDLLGFYNSKFRFNSEQNGWIKSDNDKYRLYLNGFDEFLLNSEWEKLLH